VKKKEKNQRTGVTKGQRGLGKKGGGFAKKNNGHAKAQGWRKTGGWV